MKTDPQNELTFWIEAKARELGLDLIGFAPAITPVRIEPFESWLADGRGGGMTFLSRSQEKRKNPQLVLPNVRTVISVGQSYFTDNLPEEIRRDPSRGIIASYAWGHDYHDVLVKKLQQLAVIIDEVSQESKSVCYVDSGPVFEKEFAEHAGLGFVGKNTLLISPQIGSYFFLGEILTTLDLGVSSSLEFRVSPLPSCGSCTRCLTACPTHAFPSPYILDSNLCISYLTIEYKGVIAPELCRLIGNRVYGCDDCQACCPWNGKFARPTQESAFRSDVNRRAPLLAELSLLSETEFQSRFAGSAIIRTGYARFMRNVMIALENWGTKEAKEYLDLMIKERK